MPPANSCAITFLKYGLLMGRRISRKVSIPPIETSKWLCDFGAVSGL